MNSHPWHKVNLAIFDIDGTLTDTNRVDIDCYFRALTDEFGIPDARSSSVDHNLVTDSGFVREIFRRSFGRQPTEAEIKDFKARFLSYLSDAYARDPGLFREIHGAGQMLRTLATDRTWAVSIGTGCWFESAVFKLERAGLSQQQIPMATSDDTPNRTAIVSLAAQRACEHYGTTQFKKIVVVGDRPWDVEAAKALRFAFIGVGENRLLSSYGASSIIQNYRDPQAFVQLLESAAVPTFAEAHDDITRAGE